MKIEDFTKEEKQQLLDSLLKERLNESPESREEIISLIDQISQDSVEREIDSWANSSKY